jgi:hypothetical protein
MPASDSGNRPVTRSPPGSTRNPLTLPPRSQEDWREARPGRGERGSAHRARVLVQDMRLGRFLRVIPEGRCPGTDSADAGCAGAGRGRRAMQLSADARRPATTSSCQLGSPARSASRLARDFRTPNADFPPLGAPSSAIPGCRLASVIMGQPEPDNRRGCESARAAAPNVRSRRFARFGPVGTRFAGHGPSFPGLGGCGWPRGLWLAVAARRQLPVPEAGTPCGATSGPVEASAARHANPPLCSTAAPPDDRFGCVPSWSLWRRVARALAQIMACLAHWDARPAGGGADVGDCRE